MPLLAALAIASVTLSSIPAAGAPQHDHAAATEKLGTVSFTVSCGPAAQIQFNRALALLHSFEFQRALDGFAATLEADPACGMAEWGIALSRWSNPFAAGQRPSAALQQGRAAIDRARAIGLKTARERAYVDAAACLYADTDTVPQSARMAAYRDAMARVAAAYPNDREASIFYALSLAAAAAPTDKTYADQKKAGAILERLIAAQPDHPGLAHYIIHAYDAPPLADRALDAARRYARIAPAAPHALHMPSHTFTRLGQWQDSIDTNLKSGEVARREGATAEELHTMDYRVYAYLQTGQDDAARQLLNALPEVRSRFDPNAIGSAAPGSAGVFALAAIPARYALERGDWSAAARLDVYASAFPYTEALTYFARALGASRTKDPATARTAIAALDDIERRLTDAKEPYWAGQTRIQREAAAAWLALAEGRRDDAVTAMRAAVALEDATEKSAVTPGPLAPARELLGEMLMELGQPADARLEFEATMKKEPNRFRAVNGAARAAAAMGDDVAARRYQAQLLAICARSDTPGRPELVAARQSAGRR
ncbi:MAG TPA: hypothetical protein VLJ20_14530 [Acetobacteraceae bacterium]|nr:hypothetical protein [Acetobacteraceae bacterium]